MDVFFSTFRKKRKLLGDKKSNTRKHLEICVLLSVIKYCIVWFYLSVYEFTEGKNLALDLRFDLGLEKWVNLDWPTAGRKVCFRWENCVNKYTKVAPQKKEMGVFTNLIVVIISHYMCVSKYRVVHRVIYVNYIWIKRGRGTLLERY